MNPATNATATSITQTMTQSVSSWLGGTVPSLPKAIILVIVGIITIRIVSKIMVRVLGVARLPKATIKVTVKLVDIVLWMLLIIAFLQLAGLSNVAFAISGAFAVLALAFSNGFSATVGDTISGINLSRDRHFRIGDRVKVGVDQKVEGIIIDMDVRKTRLKDEAGVIFVVPNSLIDKNTFELIERGHHGKPPESRIATARAKAASVVSRKPATMRTKKGK
ncbi:MAG: mechanosensitive ion channel [Candidatus Saccharibacteria bacterium]|jgi:small-conductance mechanosensitive channel